MIYLENILVNTVTFSDPQYIKEYKGWLYPQIIKAIKQVTADSIILVFSPSRLSNLMNYR